jgi:hypothetical protein
VWIESISCVHTVKVFATPIGRSGAKWWFARGGSNVGGLNVSNAG